MARISGVAERRGFKTICVISIEGEGLVGGGKDVLAPWIWGEGRVESWACLKDASLRPGQLPRGP